MNNITVKKIVSNVKANALVYFAIIAIIYMIYNVTTITRENYCSSCSGHEEDCSKEYFSTYTGDKDNVGFISTNVKKCNQPVFRYGIMGVATKQRVPYL